MRWISVFFASAAFAQTAAPPAAPPVTPPPAVAAPVPAAAPTAAELLRAAMEKQRGAVTAQQESVRKQAQSLGTKLVPWGPTPFLDGEAPVCDPLADDVVAPLIENAAKANNLEVKLVKAVIEQESGFRACSISPKGAQGLMQLMPETADELNVKDVFDPKENIAAGARYLKQLLDRYKGDNRLALAAYNAGMAAVDAVSSVPDIPETREYVDAILKKIK